MAMHTPAATVAMSAPTPKATLDFTMAAISMASATARSPNAPKIIVPSLLLRLLVVGETNLVRVEDPFATAADDTVGAYARNAREFGSPCDRIAKSGVERSELVGGVDQRLPAQI